jgi:hypothetical protein
MVVLKKRPLELPIQVLQPQQSLLDAAGQVHHQSVVGPHCEMGQGVVHLHLLVLPRSPLDADLPVEGGVQVVLYGAIVRSAQPGKGDST